MSKIGNLRVKLFTDGRQGPGAALASNAWIKGFTTIRSLLHEAGVIDYEPFGGNLVAAIPDRHISFRVISHHIPEMVGQARLTTTWGSKVFLKAPVTTTSGEGPYGAIRAYGVKGNLTAIFTSDRSNAPWRQTRAGRRNAYRSSPVALRTSELITA